MGKHDAHVVAYVPDLEAALQRLSASMQNFNLSSTLASVGPPARDAITRRLADASTRGAMCRGVASKDADPDARKVLLAAPLASRDANACVDGVVHIASEDDPTLSWLADQGEPGLLGAASKAETIPCPKLHVLWARVLSTRSADVYSALTVPLGYAIKRCTADMDGVLADSIVHLPATHAVVVQAIDPFTGYGKALKATCAALPEVAGGKDSALIRERASDAINHACKAPGCGRTRAAPGVCAPRMPPAQHSAALSSTHLVRDFFNEARSLRVMLWYSLRGVGASPRVGFPSRASCGGAQ